MKRAKLIIWLGLFGWLAAPATAARAAVIEVESCEQAEVQAAVDGAVTGDEVVVPGGRCTWSGAVSVADDRAITLRGAGMNVTVITMRPAGTAVDLNRSGARVTGFQFTDGTVLVDGDGWRVDSCRFQWDDFAEGVIVRGEQLGVHAEGLVDHCVFLNARVLVYGSAAMLAEGDDQHHLWSVPITFGGGEQVVYVEDCEFTATVHANAIDANYGGSYVFRHNTLNDIYIEAHSVQGDNRATRRWEIYENTINQVNRDMWVPMFLRGGTGVVFNNTLTGSITQPGIALDNVRSCDARGSGGRCDGSSPWDGNEVGGAGYPCRDQIGRSDDQWLWTAADPHPPQALDPAYCWGNTYGGEDVEFFQHGCPESQDHIQPDRDYYNGVPKPGYTPYTYPHPLIDAWGGDVTDPGDPTPQEQSDGNGCGCRTSGGPLSGGPVVLLLVVIVGLISSRRQTASR
jgi:MYXO-CTERM domain-containing protein